ncbi:MAG: hypothetical protein LBB50_01845 [Oscillospiraceae bacterium]|jgi:hypothetical protein|nr:hypothetical protein [Oscillospiraceae bacterium]
MSAISAMPSAVATWLGTLEQTQGITFLTEFPAQNKAVPLRSPIVAVGLNSVNIADKFVANDDGVLERQEYCRAAQLRLRLGVHVPFAEGGARCHEIFTLVLDMLTFASDLCLKASGCKEVTAHRDTDAFVLEAWADVEADFCPAESTGLTLASFLPKDLLCGSHISDAAIHLSGGERAWVDSPFYVGAYAGNGAATRTEDLGFRPRAIFVAAVQFPPVHPVFSTGTSAYFGFAAGSYGTMGVELISTGFRLLGGGSYALGTTTPALNVSGTQYFYFALV